MVLIVPEHQEVRASLFSIFISFLLRSPYSTWTWVHELTGEVWKTTRHTKTIQSYDCQSFVSVDKLVSTFYSTVIGLLPLICDVSPLLFHCYLVSDDSLLSVIWEEKWNSAYSKHTACACYLGCRSNGRKLRKNFLESGKGKQQNHLEIYQRGWFSWEKPMPSLCSCAMPWGIPQWLHTLFERNKYNCEKRLLWLCWSLIWKMKSD